MTRWLSILQFPFVFLPLCIYGLGVFGSDFDVLAGRLFIGLVVTLVLLDRFATRLLARIAGTSVEIALLYAAVLVAGAAYRPLHLGYWDEHSLSQATVFCVLGLVSWAVSRLASSSRGISFEVREPIEAGISTVSVALALAAIGLIWGSAWLYPMLPVLGLAIVFCLRVSVGIEGGATIGPVPAAPAFGAFEALAAVCIGIDAFLVVWDYQWVTAWAAHIAVLFSCAALGFAAGRRAGVILFVVAVLNFLAAVVLRNWVLQPLHAAGAGLGLGALLSHILQTHAQKRALRERAPFGGFTFFWMLGLALGLGLYQNLAYAGWRALLLPPLIVLFERKRRVSESS